MSALETPAGLFLAFFYLLRRRGLAVTPTQWLTLMEGLVKGLHGSSLMGFYSLARCILVRDESEVDDFDMVFAEHFRGVEAPVREIEDAVWGWLENPIPPFEMDPAMRELLDRVDVEALRREFEKRLAEQTERHDGGGRWVGTGGTSPFGHGGYHPGGIRVGGEGRNGSAVQVAAERRFREYRRDLVLDTRQLGVAWKKLRALRREGSSEELDLDETVKETSRQGGDLTIVFRPPRENNLGLLLLMDVGGTMEPFRQMVDLLFTTAHGANHFKRFGALYFHNCVYEDLFSDAAFREKTPLFDVTRSWDRETRLVLVGDAYMYPGELLDPYGAIRWRHHNEEAGIEYLRKLADHFRHAAWLNPMDERFWGAPSVAMIRELFPMYPLTLDGVQRLASDLARG
jgi:uncharacterized protein with von Willebrand factor type A (vWA) domain